MMRTRKITITVLSVITAFCLCIAAAIGFIGGKSIAGAETVEIMNDHFSVAVGSNGYRNDKISDQYVTLTYDKTFTDEAGWLNNNNLTGLLADLCDYIVINGKTFGEIKQEQKSTGEYYSADNYQGKLNWPSWNPVCIQVSATRIDVYINRAFADIGAMTIGIKDGFSYTYNGTTFKTEGDLLYKGTITADNVSTPVFEKVENLNETVAAYVYNRGVEADAENAIYTGFRTFPLKGAANTLNTNKYVSGRSLADNYMYMKEYIKVNGKSVNYWNIIKRGTHSGSNDGTITDYFDYSSNPTGSTNANQCLPIVTQIMNDGEFKIWIHTEWAAKVGIDLNNFTITFEKGMPFVNTSGVVCRTANEFIATRTNGSWSAEATEIVEVMNDNFSVTIDANGYRGDWVSNQVIYLKYNGNFHATAAWLNDKVDGIADGLDLGNNLVINGLTFNEIKAMNLGDVYPQIDGFCTGLAKGWGPVAVLAETDGIKLEINRGFADIGAMTIGLKDGFTSVYNGVTYKVEGDLTFKATINATDTYTPVFKRVEEISETPVEYASSRVTENGTANGKYNCYRTFPLYGAAHALKATASGQKDGYIGGRYLCDNYLYLKEYIKIDGYSINYWNIAKYDSSEIDCTTNPKGTNSKQYNLPIVATINTNGEFQIYIHTEWAASVGIDLNNFTITFVSGMPYVDGDGNVCRTTNEYVADCENGDWHIEEVMNDNFSIEIDANGYRNDFLTDQWLYLNYTENFHANEAWLNDKADGKADGMDLGNYLLINGKTFNELNAEGIIGTTYPSRDGRANMLQKGGVWSPVAVDAFPSKIKIEVNRGFADLGALTIGIKDGFTTTYNGKTYKVVGDLIFKPTIDTSDYRPVFKNADEVTETPAEYATARGVETAGDHAVYTGFRTFPLYQAEHTLNTVHKGCWLNDHYKFFKNYIRINGYSVDYWNIVKYDDSLTYTTNPIGNSSATFSMPIVVCTDASYAGEFKIWIHTEWAAKVGIDLDNFTITFAEGMTFLDDGGNYCKTINEYVATRKNGYWNADTEGVIKTAGASVRLSERVEGETDRSAIRFDFNVTSEFLAKFIGNNGSFKTGVTSGVLLIPQNMLDGELDLSADESVVEKVTLKAGDWAVEDDTATAMVYLYNFPSTQFKRVICARAYIADGDTVYYSDTLERSLEQVVRSFIKDGGVTDENLKNLAAQYLSGANYYDLADYAETGILAVTAGDIVKNGEAYEDVTTDGTYSLNSDGTWSFVVGELSAEGFLTIADFPPKLRAEESVWKQRLQDYADLGFSTVLLTEDDYIILDKDADGNDIKGELNPTYVMILERLLSSGLDVWVRNYNNQDDYFTSKELTTNFQKYGKVTGFYMSDEPFTNETLATKWNQPGVSMDSYTGLIAWKNEYYPDDFWHINLVPSSSYNHWDNGSEGVNGGYGDYIQYYIDNVIKKLEGGGRTVCLDCYPLRENGAGIYKDYLFDLMTGANKTRDYNRTASVGNKATYGTCIQAFAFYGGQVKAKQRNIQSANDITFQLYTAMAMGASMFEYFAYSSDYTETNGVGKGYDCITTIDGTKTDVYNYVKAANEKAFGFSKVINAYEWQGATYSAGTVENENATGFAMVDGLKISDSDMGALKSYSSDYDAVIGCFKQGERDGYMITNYTDPENGKTTKVNLTFTGYKQANVYINGKFVTINLAADGSCSIDLLSGNAAFIIPIK